MGCLCSKGNAPGYEIDSSSNTKPDTNCSSSVQLVAPTPSLTDDLIVIGNGGKLDENAMKVLTSNMSCVSVQFEDGDKKTMIFERPAKGHQRCHTMQVGRGEGKPLNRIDSVLNGSGGPESAAGWPNWLASVAGEAIKGWLPRRADSFEKLEKVSSCSLLSFHFMCICIG